MIGIDRRTGRRLSGFDQFVSRVVQVMTTPIGAREHRRAFGSRVPEVMGRLQSDELLMLAQAYAMDAFYNEANGLTDFKPSRVRCQRGELGLRMSFEGTWQGQSRSFEVSL